MLVEDPTPLGPDLNIIECYYLCSVKYTHLLEQVRQLLETEIPHFADKKFLLAISGGMDSTLLAHVFSDLGLVTVLAHCNFQLRGADADGDEAFVSELGTALQLPTKNMRFDTKTFKKEHKLSTQEAARKLRYDWFNGLLEEENLDYVVTAHHQQDQVETVLYNLCRGTALSGLCGMQTLEGALFRPLLQVAKADIESIVEEQQFSYRTDASNAETIYKRNFIRHEVLPLLEKIHPNAIANAASSASVLQEQKEVYNRQIEEIQKRVQHKNSINLELLKKEGSAVVLHELLSSYGFSPQQSRLIWQGNYQTGARFYSASHIALINRESIELSENVEPEAKQVEIRIDNSTEHIELTGGKTLKIKALKKSEHLIKKCHTFAQLDFSSLQFPLLLRPWSPGDRFRPLGMKGMKKISDFLTDRKVSRAEKEQVLVLCSGETIAWVVGFEVDDRHKITSTTTEVFELQLKEALA